MSSDTYLHNNAHPLKSAKPNFHADFTHPSLLAQPWVGAIQHALYKQTPQDFIVNECLDITFSESGEHLWLHIKKVGMNTLYVATLLAKWANIPLKDVGFSGQKDRHAVTTQWFSLRIPKQQLPQQNLAEFVHQQTLNFKSIDHQDTEESLSVIAQHWHSKKLNRGAHRANHFIIRLKEVSGSAPAIDALLQNIIKQGVPNYFGEQRFGKAGNNLKGALEWLTTGKISGKRPHPKRNREQISLLLSASRSVIFNQILCKRVATHSWNTGLDGEAFNLNGSNSIFSTTVMDDTLGERVRIGDIHPTAPLWGINNDKVQGRAKEIELDVINRHPLLPTLATGLELQKVKASRRSLRLMTPDLTWEWEDGQSLKLKFKLPTGSFATSVLMALMV